MPQGPESSACEWCANSDTALAGESLTHFATHLFDTDGFPPRWQCGDAWTPLHGWMHIISDFAIFGAYFAIPVVLAWFLLRRKDLPFPPVVWLFAAFIALCGIGHLIEGTIFWVPWYRLSGVVKAATAVVSWSTVVALIRVAPIVLEYPGLAAINSRLEAEVATRKKAEEELLASYDELRTFTSNIWDREDRMIELKREVNDLLVAQGGSPKYFLENSE